MRQMKYLRPKENRWGPTYFNQMRDSTYYSQGDLNLLGDKHKLNFIKFQRIVT